jgi:hypothetical protein
MSKLTSREATMKGLLDRWNRQARREGIDHAAGAFAGRFQGQDSVAMELLASANAFS